MISPKGDIFWLKLMDYIKENYVKGRGPVYNTGPICFSNFYREHPEYFKDVIIKDCNYFYPVTNKATNKTQTYEGKVYNYVSEKCDMKNAYTVHLWEGSWGKEINGSFNSIEKSNNPVKLIFLILLILLIIVIIILEYYFEFKNK